MPVSGKQRAAQRLVNKARKTMSYKKPTITRQLQAAVNTAITRRSEKKHINVDGAAIVLSDASMASNTDIYVVNAMREGPSWYERIGKKVQNASVRVRMNIVHEYASHLAATIGTFGNFLRWVLIYDREPNGVIPAFNTMFQDVTAQGGTVSTPISSLGLANSDRFRVLADEIVTMNPTAAPVVADYDPITGNTSSTFPCINEYFIDRYVDLSKRKLESTYKSTQATPDITNFSSGAIYLVLKPKQYVLGYNTLTVVSLAVRSKFNDI